MKRLTCCVVLLHGIILGITSASMKTLAVNGIANTVVVDNGTRIRPVKNIGKEAKQRLALGQVWVLNKNQQVAPQSYVWVV